MKIKMGKELIECDLINPNKEWRLNVNGNADKTGIGDCGLFVEAKNEKEAKDFFIKLNCDAHSKEELCARLWEEIGCDEREEAFRELRGLKDD